MRVLLARAADPTVQASAAGFGVARHLDPAKREQQASEILGALALQGCGDDGAALVDRLGAARRRRAADRQRGLCGGDAAGGRRVADEQPGSPVARGPQRGAVARDGPLRGAGAQAAGEDRRRDRQAPARPRRSSRARRSRRWAAAAAIRPARRSELLDAADQDSDRRAEAARQLIKNFGSAGADAAASALHRDPRHRPVAALAAGLSTHAAPP
jgi:hypothetical protein